MNVVSIRWSCENYVGSTIMGELDTIYSKKYAFILFVNFQCQSVIKELFSFTKMWDPKMIPLINYKQKLKVT